MRNVKSKCIGRALLIAPLCLILGVYYVFNWSLYIPYSVKDPSLKFVVFLSHILTFMQIWSFARVVLADPGKVPPYWGFYMGDAESKKRRYCLLCHLFKPDRCHHCSVCNRCILNMDHHCPWINNCIGFHNRKFFILLLLYTLVNIYFSLIFIGPVAMERTYKALEYPTKGSLHLTALYFGVFLFLAVLAVILTIFTKFHLDLVITNSTTIDSLENKTSNLYHLGTRNNLLQVFGANYWYWPLPLVGETGKPRGDGVVWPQSSPREDPRKGYDSEELADKQSSSMVEVQAVHFDLRNVQSQLTQARKEASDNDTDSSVLKRASFIDKV